jgi:transposase-like protein
MGANSDGRREQPGLQVGDSESESFWREILGSLRQRGLAGVRLVVSDAHVGLSKAVGRMFQGCSWQRSRVHHFFAEGFAYAWHLLQTVPRAQQEMVAAALGSVAREDVLAFRQFPASHWLQARNTGRHRLHPIDLRPFTQSIAAFTGPLSRE